MTHFLWPYVSAFFCLFLNLSNTLSTVKVSGLIIALVKRAMLNRCIERVLASVGNDVLKAIKQ